MEDTKVKVNIDDKLYLIKMWRLYLNSCAASFRASDLDIYQIIFSKGLNNELPMTRNYLYK